MLLPNIVRWSDMYSILLSFKLTAKARFNRSALAQKSSFERPSRKESFCPSLYSPLTSLCVLLILESHKGNLGARGGGTGEHKVATDRHHKGNLGDINQYACAPLRSCKPEYPLVLAIQGWLSVGKGLAPGPDPLIGILSPGLQHQHLHLFIAILLPALS